MPTEALRVLRAAPPLACAVLAFSMLAGCGGSDGGHLPAPPPSPPAPEIQAEVSMTAYGVPHIVAADYQSAAYASGYVYAKEYVCLVADKVMTVSGERSRYLGATGIVPDSGGTNNLDSDFYYRAVFDDATLERAHAGMSSDAAALMKGYVRGFNRWLREAAPTDIPADCRDKPWLRPLTVQDMQRMNLDRATTPGLGGFITNIANAQPPASLTAKASPRKATLRQVAVAARALASALDHPPLGSNGMALGKDVTENGSGMLLGNPHFPWDGMRRMYQMHLRIKNGIDVMGVGLGAMPLPAIGFTKDVAWTHTVSTGRRFTFFELQMQGNNYVVDGVAQPLTQRAVEVQVLESDGSLSTRTRTMYASHYGPMIVNPSYGLNWSAAKAYAIRDTNMENGRVYDFYLDVAKARSVQEVRDALVRWQAATWVNTLAADRAGSAMYADLSPVPNLSASKLSDCASSQLAQTLLPNRLFLLDGSRAACEWIVDARTITPGILPMQEMPLNIGTQYFDNSNESAWLSNPAFRNDNLSPLIGPSAKAQSLRTRMAFQQIADRLAGADGLPGNQFSLAALETVFFQSRAMSAELVLPSVQNLCASSTQGTASNGATVDLTVACNVLRTWNGRMTQTSVGVHVFREFWRRAQSIANLWQVPFDASDPVHTPRTPNVANTAVAAALRTALADGVLALQAKGLPLDAKLGDIQFVLRNGERLPLDGGDEFEGIFNKITPAAFTDAGYTEVSSGSSYIQAVTFGPDAPIARGILTYSQSVRPDSPNYADQTRVFSQSRWVDLPFTEAQIQADPALRKFTLTE